MNSPTIAAPAAPKRWLTSNRIPPLFDALIPEATTIHRVAVAVAFIAFIVVCAKIRFYLPGNPVPVTLQTFAVLSVAGIMGLRWGLVTVIGYIAIGTLGFLAFANQPWGFTTPAEGWNYVTGPTGGYLIGFVFAAAIVGALSQYGFARSNSLWAIAIGGLALYLPAIIWLAIGDFGWPADGKLMLDGMYVYMPGDVLKILGASLAVTGLWKFVDNQRSGRDRSDA